MSDHWYSQSPYRCRLDWGIPGTVRATRRGDVVVLVDTLRFSTTVTTAAHHGVFIYPCPYEEDPAEHSARVGADVAIYSLALPGRERVSLSPSAYTNLAPGTKIALSSLNGATCTRYGSDVPHLLLGALVNAGAAAEAVARLLPASASVTVIACGERSGEAGEGELRVAIEDYLGAGAILARLPFDLSPEAQVCAGAFLHARDSLEALLWESGSGRELRDKGLAEDVRHAARLDLYDTVPVLRGERFEPLG
jgi:2-phosphosulfolactate phosphatase